MSQKVIISLDAMGGAGAPDSVIAGANIARNHHHDLYYLFYGNDRILNDKISYFPNLIGNCEVFPTKDVVSDEEQPVKALRSGAESSMRKAIDAVKDGFASACVSAGNTGALMVMSKLVLKEITGIRRPAIIGIMPTQAGEGTVMLDLGANAVCDENNLFQFALMGDCFAKAVLGKQNPSIALLNVGVEQIKGRDIEKKTYDMLKRSSLNFVGYIEGHDLTKGEVDVVVTDGFSGNVVLKTAEGTVRFLMGLMKEGLTGNTLTKVGGLLVKKSIKKALSGVDPNKKNGAMFIGINGIVVKSHGSASAEGFANAISVAYDLVKRDVNKQIAKELDLMKDISSKFNIVDIIKEKSAKILGLK